MGGKVPKLKSKAAGQNATSATSPLRSPPMSATSSDSDSVSSRGDFDPVDMELDLNGGAGLSDVTTPPATPPPNTTSVSAGDLLFERHTALRLPVSFEESFSTRLAHQFMAHDQQLQETCAKLDSRMSHDRVYVFVDGSNISTSFYQDLKKKFGMRHNEPLPGCLDIVKLHEILQRDRHVMASHIVGSKAPGKTEAQYFFDAEDIGYKKTILPRIPKDSKKLFSNTSDSDDMYLRRREPMQEHQVDENLQHLMINCAIDNIRNKGVIVLVTGDGNSNDSGTSDGFPAHVVRCLTLGWAVEVYSFKSACSEAWTQPELLNNKEWAGRVSVHYLDSYLHDLCKPSFEKQLSEVAAKHATRVSCRPAPITLKRMKPILEDEGTSPRSHATHLDTKWRTPSPKEAKVTGTAMSEYQTVTVTKSHATSDYQKHLQTARTFGVGKTIFASTNGFVGGCFGSFQQCSNISGAKV
ncbi:cell wall glucanase [Colletotrichum camelliae]|nr:cell wall glucanase [Colletotrichum camelliae]